MKLVRYMNLEYGLSAIRTGLLKLVRPLDTNDPYEMMGSCTGTLQKEVKEAYKNEVRYLWAMKMADLTCLIKPDDIDICLRRVESSEIFFRQVIMDRRIEQKRNRILCFIDPERIDGTADQLMWGHYAQGGQGMRIWFDDKHLPEDYPHLYRVEYEETRPTIDLSQLKDYIDDPLWGEFFRKVLLTKSNAWSYENEIRMLIPQKSEVKYIKKINSLEFIWFPYEFIERVDFGPKGDLDETYRIIKDLRKDKCYRNIDFRVAVFGEYSYKYEYQSVNA